MEGNFRYQPITVCSENPLDPSDDRPSGEPFPGYYLGGVGTEPWSSLGGALTLSLPGESACSKFTSGSMEGQV